MALRDLRKRLEVDDYRDAIDALEESPEILDNRIDEDMAEEFSAEPQGFVEEDIERQEQAKLERDMSPYMKSIESQAEDLGIPSRTETDETEDGESLIERLGLTDVSETQKNLALTGDKDASLEEQEETTQDPYQKLLSEFEQAKKSAKTKSYVNELMNNLENVFAQYSASRTAPITKPIKSGVDLPTNQLEEVIEEYEPQFEELSSRRKQELLQKYRDKKLALNRLESLGKDVKDYQLTTLERDGIPYIYAVDKNNPEEMIEVGRRGYSPKFKTDPRTKDIIRTRAEGIETVKRREGPPRGEVAQAMENVDAQGIADPQKQEKAKKNEVNIIDKIENPRQIDRYETFKDRFLKETVDTRTTIEGIKGLKNQTDKALENEVVSGQLGASVARLFENGRLSNEDVARYTRSFSIPSRIANMAVQLLEGTLTEAKASEIKESLDVLTKSAQLAIKGRRDSLAKSVSTEIKGPSAQEIADSFYPMEEMGQFGGTRKSLTPEGKTKVSINGKEQFVPNKNVDKVKKLLEKKNIPFEILGR